MSDGAFSPSQLIPPMGYMPGATLPRLETVEKAARTSSTTWQDLDAHPYVIYGSIFVLSVDSAMYPFEVIRTRMQVDTWVLMCTMKVSRNGSVSYMLRRIIKVEGPARLYRGIVPSVLGSFPGQASYFSTYEFSQHKYTSIFSQWFPDSAMAKGPVAHALAGTTAELVGAVFYVPSDMISQRLQMQPRINFFHVNKQYKNAVDVAIDVYRSSGLRGFYRGYFPHILACAPSSAVSWATYELGKKHLGLYLPRTNEFIVNALSASLAATCAVLVSNPFDVLRTRIQTQDYNSKGGGKIVRMARRIVREEGLFKGFYKGLRPRLFVAVPGTMVTLGGYELIKRWSRNDKTEQERNA